MGLVKQILINLKGLGDQSLSLFSGNHLANDLFVHDVILEHTLQQCSKLTYDKLLVTYNKICLLNNVKPNEKLYDSWLAKTHSTIISIVDNEFVKLRNPEDFVLRYTTNVNTYIFREGNI